MGIVGVEALDPDRSAADPPGRSGRGTIGDQGVPFVLVGGMCLIETRAELRVDLGLLLQPPDPARPLETADPGSGQRASEPIEGGKRGPVVVSDIGGGSTELVTREGAVSIDIGSVRLTERAIPTRPPPPSEMARARSLVADRFRDIRLETGTLIGVAGTWTSLAAIAQDLPEYSMDMVHGHRMKRSELRAVIDSLAGKTVEETAAIPSLDPKRAPVILAGALVADGVMGSLVVGEVMVSEHDTLDGVAMELLALP